MKSNFAQVSRAVIYLFAAGALLLAVPASAQSDSKKEEGPKETEEFTERGIDIAIRGGERKERLPVAVPETIVESKGFKSYGRELTSYLRRDVNLSGYFKALTEEQFFFDPSKEGMTQSDIRFEDWKNVGAKAVIKTRITKQKEGNNAVLDFRLYLVDKGQRAYLGWTHETIEDDNQIRSRVHAFMNEVVKYYTGTPGVFGTKIAYVRPGGNGLKQIYKKSFGDREGAQVTSNASINLLPGWGSDSLFYTSYRHHNPDLWRYRDGVSKKISSRKGQNTGPAYCDGKLAVTLSMGGENADIYLINPESGKILKRLTDHWAIDTSPTWKSDCSKLAFVSGRSGQAQIYVMKANGSDIRRLTYQGNYNTQPEWSPVEDVIVFTARDERSAFDIFLVDMEGNIKRLTQNQGNNQDPSFSPDGRYVIFQSDRRGGERMWLMTSDGEFQTPVSGSEVKYSAPVWKK